MSGFPSGRNFEIQKFSWGELWFPNCPDFSRGEILNVKISPGEKSEHSGEHRFSRGDMCIFLCVRISPREKF